MLQAHTEGSSLRGISRISGLAYDIVVSIIQAASEKAQMVHNVEVQAVDTYAIGADELWSFVEKTKELLARQTRNWRLLDSYKFSSIERVDFIWSHRQAY